MDNNSELAQVNDFTNRTVVDSLGDKVGTVSDVYLDEDTGQPEWLAISTGMFGTKTSFVPIAGAGFDQSGNVVIGYAKDIVKDAPRAEADGHLSEAEEQELYTYYGRDDYRSTTAQDMASTGNVAPRAQVDTAAVTDADRASMVRSEEELSIDKHVEERGRVKLRKWVETDQVNVTVPVQRQMARLVREPVTDGTNVGVADFTEGEEEIVLSEEIVDVNKRVVAKERVGLEVDTVVDNVAVDESLRKERVEVDGDTVIDERSR